MTARQSPRTWIGSAANGEDKNEAKRKLRDNNDKYMLGTGHSNNI